MPAPRSRLGNLAHTLVWPLAAVTCFLAHFIRASAYRLMDRGDSWRRAERQPVPDAVREEVGMLLRPLQAKLDDLHRWEVIAEGDEKKEVHLQRVRFTREALEQVKSILR